MRYFIFILIIVFWFAVGIAFADVSITAGVRFNNDNIHTSYQPPVAFSNEINGEFFGELIDGTPFSQTNIVNDLTRLQKFQIQDAYWYVSDKGEIWADSDTQALSIYLTK